MAKLSIIVAAAAAILALAVFVYVTDAPSYAGTASETCNNCHVMDPMYENYYHAAHRARRRMRGLPPAPREPGGLLPREGPPGGA